jgi:enamine deaminase RidA (YjgF/YER057c/UK114 family)
MARIKRGSSILYSSEKRLAGMKSIDPNLDLNNGFSLAVFTAKTDALRQLLENYNTLLSTLDALLTNIVASEQDLRDVSEHMLVGVAAKYGKNSNEYKMAGGVRKAERKRPTRSPSETPAVTT